MLVFYVGSIMFFNGTFYIMMKAIDKELENDGYKEVKKVKNIAKTLISLVKVIGMSMIPVINIIFPIVALVGSDDLINSTKDDLIADGTYVKKEEPEEIKELGKEEEKNTIIMYNVNNELTRTQKINALKEELSRLTGEEIKIESSNNQLKKRK